MKKLLLLCIALALNLSGCGNITNGTSGTLSVAAPSASNSIVTAIATYTPSTGSALAGQTINFRWYTYTVTTQVTSAETTTSGVTNGAGSTTSNFTLSSPRTENVIVYVIASTAGLSNNEGWQSVIVTP